MKSILIFTDYFFPGNSAGGPITSISNLYDFLRRDFKVVIVTRNFDLSSERPYENVVYDSLTQFDRYSVIYLSRIVLGSVHRAIKLAKPDIIYLNSLFSPFTRAVLLLRYVGVIKCKVYLAPRGEFQVNAIAMKRGRKVAYIAFLKLFGLVNGVRFHATDKIEADRIRVFLRSAEVFTLPNLPRPVQAAPREKDGGQLSLVFIGRIRNNKNLLYALRVLSNCSVDVALDIYGPIEDKGYWSECAGLIDNLRSHVHVSYKGLLAHGDVPQVLLKYHGLLLPTETENFGHAIVEAMQSGVVPIISDQTPWRHLQEHGAGWDINLSRPDLFRDAIHHLHALNAPAFRELSAGTIRYIQKKLKVDQLALEYSRIFGKEKNDSES